MQLQIKRLPHAFGDENQTAIEIPKYQTAGAAGFDLQSTITMAIEPGERAAIPTGLAVAVPDGYELQVRPRSGLAMKKGISIVNTPGTVDSDYRGELIILLINHDKHSTFIVTRGDRIAQAVVSPVIQVDFLEVEDLPETVRGTGGFGSTGIT